MYILTADLTDTGCVIPVSMATSIVC